MAGSPVDAYFRRPSQWAAEREALRAVLLGCGLDEELKWGKPCYSQGGNNLVILQEMKEFVALMFFKGALLDDPRGVLESQGPNSRSAMRVCFRSVADVKRLTPAAKALVKSAIAVEASGAKVAPAPTLELVEELQRRLDRDKKLAAAFAGLTPGRRREYNLHFASAKQSATRESRIDKCVPNILAGKGMRDA
jgi:uncharacterized protein YdeI (YjbR/CyaY-like superfamily)